MRRLDAPEIARPSGRIAAAAEGIARRRIVEVVSVAGLGLTVLFSLIQGYVIYRAHTARKTAMYRAVARRDGVAIRRLLAEGVGANYRARYGVTPLMAACESGDRSLMAELLGRGADVRAVDDEGQTVLMHAAMSDAATVRATLRLGVSMDVQSRSGTTALMVAVVKGKLDVVRLLLDTGANPWLRDEFGMTAFDAVPQCEDPAVATALGRLLRGRMSSTRAHSSRSRRPRK